MWSTTRKSFRRSTRAAQLQTRRQTSQSPRWQTHQPCGPATTRAWSARFLRSPTKTNLIGKTTPLKSRRTCLSLAAWMKTRHVQKMISKSQSKCLNLWPIARINSSATTSRLRAWQRLKCRPLLRESLWRSRASRSQWLIWSKMLSSSEWRRNWLSGNSGLLRCKINAGMCGCAPKRQSASLILSNAS